MNMPSVLKIIVAMFFMSILPVSGLDFNKIFFSANLYAADYAKTEWPKRAATLEQMKDWQGLLDWCRKWTKSETESAVAWDYLGLAYGNLKRYDDAIFAFRQALRINPRYASAWYKLGISYRDLKRYPDALEAFRQALSIDPEQAAAWGNLGNTYSRLERLDDAIEAYRQALRINPKDALLWYILGNTYILSGNRSAALETVKELRRLNPAKADELFNMIVPR